MTQARIHLIYARARNGVIGRDNQLPWHLPEDMAFFKQKTAGGTVVMGRKTWDSLPERFRPLPGRANVVVTRQGDWAADGAQRAGSLDEALALAVDGADASGEAVRVWVIGGGELFRQALPRADRLEVTELDLDVAGDAFAPERGPEWRLAAVEPAASGNEPRWHTSRSGIRYRFLSLER